MPRAASTMAPMQGRWPPGKMCARMKSLDAQYPAYRSSGPLIACPPARTCPGLGLITGPLMWQTSPSHQRLKEQMYELHRYSRHG